MRVMSVGLSADPERDWGEAEGATGIEGGGGREREREKRQR